MKKHSFQPTPSIFGIQEMTDEQQVQDAFVAYVGGIARAECLERIWRNTYPSLGMTKEQLFYRKAKKKGFTDMEIDAFMLL